MTKALPFQERTKGLHVLRLRKQSTLLDTTTGFPSKWRLKFYTDDVSLPRSGRAPDWSCRTWNLLQPIWNTTLLGSDTSSVWNFCARSYDVFSWGNQWQRREMSAVFSGHHGSCKWFVLAGIVSVGYYKEITLHLKWGKYTTHYGRLYERK